MNKHLDGLTGALVAVAHKDMDLMWCVVGILRHHFMGHWSVIAQDGSCIHFREDMVLDILWPDTGFRSEIPWPEIIM